MSKCYSKFTYGFVASAALFVAGGAFAQCDPDTAGDYTDTEFDSGADCSSTGGVDNNGGWNQLDANGDYMYLEAGDHAPGDSFRVKGVVGTYNGPCDGGNNNSRDLDWVRFSVTEPCYVTITLSMSDSAGVPLDGVNMYDLFFMEQGSDPATAIDLIGEYGLDGCPHNMLYTFANGQQQARFPVAAGELLLIVTTPFEPITGEIHYGGPMSYGLDVGITGYDNASCTTATNDCITTSQSAGCSDGACCELVCGFVPGCCDSAWDAACVAEGVTSCGNFIYVCENPWPGASNDCVGTAELVLGLPAFVSFDCTDANADGPNDVVTQCSSSFSHDVWYIVGPTPAPGELLVTMCGQGNTGDAVMALYNLGESADIGDPQDLPAKYIACRDDVCDDNGDGTVDLAGPAGINLIGVPANTFWLVRVGSFYDKDLTVQAPGFAGSMTVGFRAVFVDHGVQKYCVNAGTNSNVGLVSGWSTSANTKRWSMIPFDMTVSGSVDGFDFAAFDSSSPDVISWKIINRNTDGGSYGQNGRPFGSTGNFDQSQVVAEGSVAHDFVNDWADVGDSIGERHFIDIETPFQLEPGSYYFTCYGEYADGSTGAAFAWAMYGADGPIQETTAQVVITTSEAAGASSVGTWPAGTPHGWRGIGTGPKMTFYSLGVNYTTQLADPKGLLYNCSFNLKGQLAAACFGDMDGSGEVDSGDVGIVLLDTGPCAGCPTDLDGSGEVDSGDVGLVLLSSGPCG